MFSVHDTSAKISVFLASQTGETDNIPVYTYGLEIILGALIKFVLIFLLAEMLGIFKPTLIILCISAIFRLLSGGVHCSAYYRCLICGLAVFLSLGYLGHSAVLNMAMFASKILTVTGFMIVLLITGGYAPVGTEQKPVTKTSDKQKMKWLSIGYIMLLFGIVWLINFNRSVTLPIVIGLLWQAFTLTPAGNWVIKKADRMLTFSSKSKKFRKEVNSA